MLDAKTIELLEGLKELCDTLAPTALTKEHIEDFMFALNEGKTIYQAQESVYFNHNGN